MSLWESFLRPVLTDTVTLLTAVSLMLVIGQRLDRLLNGRIRARLQGLLGIDAITIAMLDMAEAQNTLSETVCEEHDLDEDEVDHVDVEAIREAVADEEAMRGDFTRGGGD